MQLRQIPSVWQAFQSLASPRLPPFLGDLLVTGANQVPAGPSCQITRHRRFQVKFGFHSSQFWSSPSAASMLRPSLWKNHGCEALKGPRWRLAAPCDCHAIVDGRSFPTSQLAHVIAISKQRSPTARSGVSITSAVSVDRYLFPTATFRHAKNLCCPFQPVEEFRSGASASKWKL